MHLKKQHFILILLAFFCFSCKQGGSEQKQLENSAEQTSKLLDSNSTNSIQNKTPKRYSNARPNEIREKLNLKLAQKYAEIDSEFDLKRDSLNSLDLWNGSKNLAIREEWLYNREARMIEALGQINWEEISEPYN